MSRVMPCITIRTCIYVLLHNFVKSWQLKLSYLSGGGLAGGGGGGLAKLEIKDTTLTLEALRQLLSFLSCFISRLGRGPWCSGKAAFLESRRSRVRTPLWPSNRMFLPRSHEWFNIVESLCDREVACSASDHQGSNFESCVWRAFISPSSGGSPGPGYPIYAQRWPKSPWKERGTIRFIPELVHNLASALAPRAPLLKAHLFNSSLGFSSYWERNECFNIEIFQMFAHKLNLCL